ncbi:MULTISPECIES: molybdopterin-dependent oxidoreductase [unclassified Sulfitobacter]|uniref:molybdopterin-dependent oxidoreductase n=2 Tax=Sulfitobacter TaxID=60136 RepID=UPI003748287F
MMHSKKIWGAVIAIFVLILPNFGLAQTILSLTTSKQSVDFTLEQLQTLPQTTVVTANDYVEPSAVFQGPLLRTVLEALEIDKDAELKMIALNDFTSTVPASDAFDYDVIMAVLRDGERMTVRNKGPIWVIYPMDDNPELRSDIYNDRLVWQLKEIAVE